MMVVFMTESVCSDVLTDKIRLKVYKEVMFEFMEGYYKLQDENRMLRDMLKTRKESEIYG